MAAVLDEIAPDLAEWIAAQPMFFVATAPDDPSGHVNLSPKGLDTFRVLGPHRVAYLDLTGSGIETIAHVRANPRITVMFCAFNGNPRICRLYGTATVHEVGTEGYAALVSHFPELPGARAVLEIDVTRVSTSCGYAVPLMDLVSDRDRLVKWAEAKGHEGLIAYRGSKNAASLDGMRGFGS